MMVQVGGWQFHSFLFFFYIQIHWYIYKTIYLYIGIVYKKNSFNIMYPYVWWFVRQRIVVYRYKSVLILFFSCYFFWFWLYECKYLHNFSFILVYYSIKMQFVCDYLIIMMWKMCTNNLFINIIYYFVYKNIDRIVLYFWF